jgi:hypothetical protein
LDKGRAVIAVDLFLTGDYHNAFAETKRDTQGFLETFAPTTAAYRVQDLLTAKAFVALRRDLTGPVDVVGVGEAGLPVLFAGAADDGFGRVVVDAGGFNPHDDDMWVKRFYVPSIRALGDVATAAFLMEGGDLIICNVRPEAPWPVPAEMLTAASVAEVLTGTGG